MYLLGDVHGNIEGLNKALCRAGLIDNHGLRTTQEPIWSIGDLANCVRDSVEGDLRCLSLLDRELIDGIVIGNHELPYLDPMNTFSGFHFDPEVSAVITRLWQEGKIVPALVHGEQLITHAGLSANLCISEIDSADLAFDLLTQAWECGNFSHSWFSAVGRARGGSSACGGVVWCDFEKELQPTAFPQICGHTPRGLRMKGNALCIDAGCKDGETEPLVLRLL